MKCDLLNITQMEMSGQTRGEKIDYKEFLLKKTKQKKTRNI